jgi:hypothetical protein
VPVDVEISTGWEDWLVAIIPAAATALVAVLVVALGHRFTMRQLDRTLAATVDIESRKWELDQRRDAYLTYIHAVIQYGDAAVHLTSFGDDAVPPLGRERLGPDHREHAMRMMELLGEVQLASTTVDIVGSAEISQAALGMYVVMSEHGKAYREFLDDPVGQRAEYREAAERVLLAVGTRKAVARADLSGFGSDGPDEDAAPPR